MFAVSKENFSVLYETVPYMQNLTSKCTQPKQTDKVEVITTPNTEVNPTLIVTDMKEMKTENINQKVI